MKNLDRFINRLNKIGIKIIMWGNFPWVYIYSINDNVVIEKFNSEHGFVVAILPTGLNENSTKFSDISEIFKLIRKYVK